MRFLSPQWIEAADAALAAATGAPPERVVIDQEIVGVATYRVTVDAGIASVASLPTHPTEAADVTFGQDYATARAIAQGDTDAHQAFLLGRIRFSGDVDVLLARRDTFRWIATALAPLMARTSFEAPATA